MGIMFGGWANDPYEQDERDLERRLGPEVYAQLLKQREIDRKKWRDEHPVKWSKSEPKVTEADIICRIQKEPFKVLEEMRVTRIDDDGTIWGRMLTNNPMQDPHQGAEYMWEGEYAKLNY